LARKFRINSLKLSGNSRPNNGDRTVVEVKSKTSCDYISKSRINGEMPPTN
jgi:hypothetical protein